MKEFLKKHCASCILGLIIILLGIICIALSCTPITKAGYTATYIKGQQKIVETIRFDGNGECSAIAKVNDKESEKAKSKYSVDKGVLIINDTKAGICNAFSLKLGAETYYCNPAIGSFVFFMISLIIIILIFIRTLMKENNQKTLKERIVQLEKEVAELKAHDKDGQE